MKWHRILRMCGGAAALTCAAAGFAQETLVTNSSRFQIPFEIETAPGEVPQGFAVLFGSRNGGATWERLQTVPAAQKHFQFAAPRDGGYAFAVRMMDPQGNLTSQIDGSAPELLVSIDTTIPELDLKLHETGPGQLLLSWQAADTNVAPATLLIEYSEGQDGRWKKVETGASAAGRVSLSVQAGAVVAVRGTVSDTAGNQGKSAAQIVLSPFSSGASTVAGRPAKPALPELNVEPMGANPFAVAEGQSGFGAVPGLPNASGLPAIPPTRSNVPPTGRPSGLPSLPDLTATEPGNSELTTAAQGGPAPAAQQQLVNSSVFDLVYQLEEVGPSGIGAVELFVTEDGGLKWFRYGNDTDLKSPMQVDVQGEGVFGFAIRVKNGLGFVDPPPRSGESPAIIVTVDQTGPQIDFPQPSVTTEGSGAVQFQWQVADHHPVPIPVRLEYSGSPTGPWTPVFDWQADTAGYTWPVNPGIPPAAFFRLLARDAAGNVSSVQTAQAVLIDVKRPTVSGLRVQAVSGSPSAVRGY